MICRLIFIAFLGLVLAQPVMGQSTNAATPSDPALPGCDAQARLAQIELPSDVEVGFVQTHKNPMLRAAVQQRGVLVRESGGDLLMRIETPRWEERRLSATAVALTRKENNRRGGGTHTATRSMRLDPGQPQHLALLAMYAAVDGDVQMLREHFLLSCAEIPAGWQITLQARATAPAASMPRLLLHGVGQHLSGYRSETFDATGVLQQFLYVDILVEPSDP